MAPNQGERIARLEEKVSNLVGDMEEVKEQLKKIAGHTGPTRSKMEALKKAIYTALNMDALGNPKQYDAEHHPGRRAGDSSSMSDKVLRYFINRILPPVIVWAILGGLAFWIAVNNQLIAGI